MLDRGVYLPPSGHEAWFLSLAHSESETDKRAIAEEWTSSALAGQAEPPAFAGAGSGGWRTGMSSRAFRVRSWSRPVATSRSTG